MGAYVLARIPYVLVQVPTTYLYSSDRHLPLVNRYLAWGIEATPYTLRVQSIHSFCIILRTWKRTETILSHSVYEILSSESPSSDIIILKHITNAKVWMERLMQVRVCLFLHHAIVSDRIGPKFCNDVGLHGKGYFYLSSHEKEIIVKRFHGNNECETVPRKSLSLHT